MPLAIGVSGAAYGPQDVLLLESLGELQLYGSSNRVGTYSWTSDNGTVSCVVTTGPYLVAPMGCLLLGNHYAFTLRLTQASGQWTTKQVRCGQYRESYICLRLLCLCFSLADKRQAEPRAAGRQLHGAIPPRHGARDRFPAAMPRLA